MNRRIQRRRAKGWRIPPGTVCVSRPSRWGNPWRVEHNGDQWYAVAVDPSWPWDGPFRSKRDASAAAVRLWDLHTGALGLIEPDDLTGWLAPLAGVDLACWCPLVGPDGEPWPCHADILLTLVAEVTGRADT